MPLGLGLALGLGGAGGGAPAARTVRVAVGSIGTVTTIARVLGSSSAIALAAGSDGNLSLVGLELRLVAAIGAGVSQKAIVRETLGDLIVQFPVTVVATPATPAPTPAPTPTPTPAPTPTPTPTPGEPASISAPTLTRASAAGAAPFRMVIATDDTVYAGYYFVVQVASSNTFAGDTIEQECRYFITGDDLEDGVWDLTRAVPAFDPFLDAGSHFVRGWFESDSGLVSPYSNDVDASTVSPIEFDPTTYKGEPAYDTKHDITMTFPAGISIIATSHDLTTLGVPAANGNPAIFAAKLNSKQSGFAYLNLWIIDFPTAGSKTLHATHPGALDVLYVKEKIIGLNPAPVALLNKGDGDGFGNHFTVDIDVPSAGLAVGVISISNSTARSDASAGSFFGPSVVDPATDGRLEIQYRLIDGRLGYDGPAHDGNISTYAISVFTGAVFGSN